MLVFIAAAIAARPAAHRPATPDPRTIIVSAIDAMGGRDRLTRAETLRLNGTQIEYLLGNAERADGPWRTQLTVFSELWDFGSGKVRRTTRGAGSAAGPTDAVTIAADSVIIAGGGGRPVAPSYGGFLEAIQERMVSTPSRALMLAAQSPSPQWLGSVMRMGVPHDIIGYRAGNTPVRLEIDRYSHLPTAVETAGAPVLEVRTAIFGDVTTRTEYLDWTSQNDGLWWPMQQRQFVNGELVRDMTMSTLQPGATAPADSFAISDSLRTAYATTLAFTPRRFKLGSRPEPKQPGEGIVRLADNWAMTLVKQDDGVVIFEAHLSDHYIKQVVSEVDRRWPGSPIKAFVLTSDPWAHLGGVREVIAMGIPIYVHAASIPFLTRIANARYTIEPDDLARAHRTPHFIPVDGRTVIGTGHNRIELFPVRGAYAERMLMAYFPGRRLLYGADLIFAQRTAAAPAPITFSRTPALELRTAVAREQLAVDSVFSVQPGYPIFAWQDFIPTGSTQ